MKEKRNLSEYFYKRSSLPRVLAISIIITIIVLGWYSSRSLSNYRYLRSERELILNLKELQGSIIYLDELLTMSSRMAASSGDLKWEERYLDHVSKLDSCINKVYTYFSDSSLQTGIGITHLANNVLVEMEQEAFELVRINKKEEALALLNSEKYMVQKDLYNQGLVNLNETINRSVSRKVSTEEQDALNHFRISLFLLIFLAFIWMVGFYLVRSWRKALTRSNEILKRELEERQKAEASSRAKSVFLENMSHEIRTPLNAILGHSQLLSKDKSLSGIQLENVRSISSSGKLLLSILNDLLDIAEIDSEEASISNDTCILGQILDDLNDIISEKTISKNLEFKIESDRGVPKAFIADRQRLTKVIRHLLDNAVKFTEKGEIKLSVGSNDEQLHFRVSDTGQGIAKEKLDRIFESFEQGLETRQVVSGAGLGLSICKKFATLMGGKILVESQPGEGSVFTLSIPYIESDSSNAENKDRRDELIINDHVSDLPDPESVRSIPTELKDRILEAAVKGDFQEIKIVSDKLMDIDRKLATYLIQLAEAFEFDRIRELLSDKGK